MDPESANSFPVVGTVIGAPVLPDAASGPTNEVMLPDAAACQSSPRIGSTGGGTLSLEERLAHGALRRKHDELLSEIQRLSRDREPEAEDYPDELYAIATRIRYLVDRL